MWARIYQMDFRAGRGQAPLEAPNHIPARSNDLTFRCNCHTAVFADRARSGELAGGGTVWGRRMTDDGAVHTHTL